MTDSHGWRSRALDRPHLTVALPCLVVTLLLAAPLGAPIPVPGLDPSWRLALNTFGDLQFGRDIVFTYGPWGFLDTPVITSRATYAVALLVRVLVITALWLVSVRSLVQQWPLWLAAPVASVFVVLVAPSDMSTLAVALAAQYVVWRALARDRADHPRADLVAVAAVAGLAALILQVKVSNGVAVTALALLAVVTSPGLTGRRRQLTAWACAGLAFVGVLVTTWLVRGQSLAHLVGWARGSLDLTTGYPEAMGFEYPDLSLLGYVMAVLLGLLAVAAAFPRLRELRPRLMVGPLLVLAVAGGFAFKAAFTRHDDFHQGLYFVIVGALLLGLVGTSRTGSWLAAGGVVLATAMAVSTLPHAPGPVAAADRWQADASVLTSREHQLELLAAARAAMLASHQVPQSLLDRVGSKPVSIDPYESSVAWAYDLNWGPVPVFQLYSAYTPALDRLNATALREASNRQRILRHEYPYTDGRNPLWDSPLYHLALGCTYQTEAVEASWALLAKGRSRCGAPESLGAEHVAANSAIDVPSASDDEILLARFTPDEPSLVSRLGRALVKSFTPMHVAADDLEFRLSRKTSPSGLLVRFPTIEAGAYAAFDIESLSFSEPGTMEFVRIPVRR